VLTLSPAVRIYLATGATDLRRSIDGLAALVRERFTLDPLSGHLFLFRNRRGDRLKILAWDRGGFWVLYKRLERGTFAWPVDDDVPRVELRSPDLLLFERGLAEQAIGAEYIAHYLGTPMPPLPFTDADRPPTISAPSLPRAGRVQSAAGARRGGAQRSLWTRSSTAAPSRLVGGRS
jgi:hypothetical protein